MERVCFKILVANITAMMRCEERSRIYPEWSQEWL